MLGSEFDLLITILIVILGIAIGRDFGNDNCYVKRQLEKIRR